MAMSVIADKIRPLGNAIVRRKNLAAASTPGQAGYINGAGNFAKADANTAAAAKARGVIVSDRCGSTSFSSGQRVDVVLYGPVAGFEGMTPGEDVFLDTVAGQLTQTPPAASGKFVYRIGYAESDTVLMVDPQNWVPAANS